MEKYPKFIIEDGKLILMKVTYHKDMVTDKTKVKGGGWFVYSASDNTFTLSGENHDFGKATLEDIRQCIESGNVYSDNRLYRNISKNHKFKYDTGTEIIELTPIVKTIDITTIIMSPSWGQILDLIQEKGTIRISSSDNDNFKKLLDSVNLKYKVEEDEEKKLTRFTLIKS